MVFVSLMITLNLLGLVLADGNSTGLGFVRSAKDQPVPPIYPIGFKNGSFAKTAGHLFDVDGKVGYFAGTNAWWLGHLTKNEDIDKAMQEIVDANYKIVRVWGFGDILDDPPSDKDPDPKAVWYQQHSTNGTQARINYGPNGLQRLDYVVSTAERLGLKLVLPFVNNWSDLGGLAVYYSAYGSQVVFYENLRAQEVYRDFIRILVDRYRRSSAIFSWQLGNEPRCEGCEPSVLYNWASNTSAYIKSLDPHHMVTMGDEGWFDPGSGYRDVDGSITVAYAAHGGVDFLGNLNISTLDYGTFHLYPSQWGYSYDWGNHWIRQHADAGARLHKPVVLEEYGSPNRMNHSIVLLPWQQTILNSSVAADQLWQFGPVNLSMNGTVFGDEYSIYIDHDEFQAVGTRHAEAMLAKSVQ